MHGFGFFYFNKFYKLTNCYFISDNSVLKKNISILFCPTLSNNFRSPFEKSLVHDLSDNKILVSYYSTESYNDESKVCNTTQPQKKISIFQKMKQLYRDYWRVLIPVHIVTSIGWVGIFWTAAKKYSLILKHIIYILIIFNY